MIQPDPSPYPAVAKFLSWVIPFREGAQVTDAQYQVLKNRNEWAHTLTCVLSLTGFVGGAFMPRWIRGPESVITGWDIAILFGLGTGLPIFFILLLGLAGRKRLWEFLVYYSLKYGCDARKLYLFFFSPFIVLGLLGTYFAYFQL